MAGSKLFGNGMESINPSQSRNQALGIDCLEFKSFVKNTLQGFCTLRLQPSGLLLKECTLHEKNGSRWVSFPGRPWTGKDGTTQYTNFVEFVSREHADTFRELALAAIDRFRASTK